MSDSKLDKALKIYGAEHSDERRCTTLIWKCTVKWMSHHSFLTIKQVAPSSRTDPYCPMSAMSHHSTSVVSTADHEACVSIKKVTTRTSVVYRARQKPQPTYCRKLDSLTLAIQSPTISRTMCISCKDIKEATHSHARCSKMVAARATMHATWLTQITHLSPLLPTICDSTPSEKSHRPRPLVS
jgi:hypothetical protein